MKKIFLFAALLAFVLTGCKRTKYDYETVEGDPMHAQIYTLDNGLKIYMTVNKEQPRIQTYIAVHAGGKDDPAESTGLAHYLEHLMFKGTNHFGTWNFEKESVELAKIDSLYEVYNKTTDEARRKAIYHEIDSVSYEASRYSIANEYDKLMATIGANGTNAYTSEDVTCYTEDIPSNQMENWAKIQADRFQNMVIRLFHTELEAVYEEKNIGMSSDIQKVIEVIDRSLYPNHPYGQHTVIGTQEHLKNPSIVNIRKYFQNYYRPNNVAICLSGDFDPDEAVDIIKKYFGEWQPNDNITRNEVKPEAPLSEPIVREVMGEEAEQLWMAWRTPAAKDEDQVALNIISTMLHNGNAGLFDLDLNQKHLVLESACFNMTRADNSELIALAYPMPGQTLDEARELILAEVAKLRNGEFEDTLLSSAITDYKLMVQKSFEENEERASQFVNAFVNGQEWSEAVAVVEKTGKLTREDIVRVAKKYLGATNYVVVNKRQGEDLTIQKIEKPEINPVMLNRDSVSQFVRDIQQTEVKPIAPQFIDFKKDLDFAKADKGIEVIGKKNVLNQTFSLTYVYGFGRNDDRYINTAISYLDYLGTDKMSAADFKKKLYSLGCSFNANTTGTKTYLTVSGLDENKAEALRLVEDLLANLKADAEALDNMKSAMLQERQMQLSDQRRCSGLLSTYARYGAEYVKQTTLTNDEILALDAQKLVDKVKSLSTIQHKVAYYGTSELKDVVALINAEHKTAKKLQPAPKGKKMYQLPTPVDAVWFANYNAPTAIVNQLTNIEMTFNPDILGVLALYNEYFGSSMNAIVFQEIRESRGLAYSAWASFNRVGFNDDPYTFTASAMTQADKVQECHTTFMDIINNMPESEKSFDIAKTALLTRLRTERTTRDAIIWHYFDALDLGIDYDFNAKIFEQAENLTMKDLVAFQQKYVKNRTYTYSVIADKTRVDMDVVKSFGKLNVVDVKDASGYFD